MEGVNEESQSQKKGAKEHAEMEAPPPTPKGIAPRSSSPQKADPVVQVKASQPPREATPPTSDGVAPPSAQIGNGESDGDDDETDQDSNQHADDDETMHDLQVYDWMKLEQEYEAAMARCDEKEAEATDEFKKLGNYFAQWSNVSQTEDKVRSAKRYKTREAHIMHSEAEYQKKKEHFDKVVNAFKSAMELLRST